jgi:ankyrin repeat protein
LTHDIFEAVRAGDTQRVQALLAADPGLVNARNERGHTPVLIAQYHHKPETVGVLLAARPELDIFDAASVGQTERVAELLDRDPKLLHARSSDGFAPLGLAAFFGQAETVKLLLARGADPKAKQAMDASAIGLAAMKGHHDVLKLLKGQA